MAVQNVGVHESVTQPVPPLEGEDLATAHWEDARHWISIYNDLIRFKQVVLERVSRELAKLPPEAYTAAVRDVNFIELQLEGYFARLELWYERVWRLQGLWLDSAARTVTHRGMEASLTNREFQLLSFLIDHPQRYYNVEQIMTHAWSDASLFPEEVRNYILRVRRILARMRVPVEIVNRPGRGYSLIYRVNDPLPEPDLGNQPAATV
ncbi:MAG: winged helix-turn-helix domain-containing protein [Candidatus Dormibacteria bacterium]